MSKYNRLLDIKSLTAQKSHFLFGARSTGKSTLLEECFPNALVFDLLDEDIFERLLRSPKIIFESIQNPNQIVIIDEIQRMPKLLNEVQRIMRKNPNHFILTGSSARKLKHGGANLLGGRAWEAHLHPLCMKEIHDFDLNRYLNVGGLPHIYLSKNPASELKNYIKLYIREEIVAEALTRKLEYFLNFLDVLSINNGEELHFQNLSNDSAVPARTLQNYVQILEDTLIGFQVPGFTKGSKRKAITRSKFYFFDVGVANVLAKRGEIMEKSELFGKAFEHFIIREIKTRLSYSDSDDLLCYWRTTSGHEVDLIIGNKMAIEIKATTQVNDGHLKGLKALREEGLIEKFYVVSQDSHERTIDGIKVVHYKKFFENFI